MVYRAWKYVVRKLVRKKPLIFNIVFSGTLMGFAELCQQFIALNSVRKYLSYLNAIFNKSVYGSSNYSYQKIRDPSIVYVARLTILFMVDS